MVLESSSQTAPVKRGLALSGGGFRASLFHLGVFAYLADIGVLQQIRYLSTVSGGSIIGAAYYLKVMELLEGRRKDGLRADDPQAYQKIICELIALFLDGVQKNVLMRTFLNPIKNMMMFHEHYSRTDYIGELYTKYLYAPIWTGMGKALVNDAIPLHKLKIRPDGKAPGDIEAYNDQVAHKIPILIINATTLNSGHNWQFTASYVGEGKTASSNGKSERTFFDAKKEEPVDCNRIFERRYFGTDYTKEYGRKVGARINAKLKELTLGDAVATSACVPAIFPPMAIHDLYDDEFVIQLVDGGVFDNQGLRALYDKRATHIICSDATAQLPDEAQPSTKFYRVIYRSLDVVMDGLREVQLGEFYRANPGYKLTAANLLHWLQPVSPKSDDPEIVPPSAKMMRALSEIRTDLDSFHDQEAFALMYAGYVLCYERMRDTYGSKAAKEHRWLFWSIKPHVNASPLLGKLTVSRWRLFKVFRLYDFQAWLWGSVLGGAGIGGVGWLAWHFWDQSLEPVLGSLTAPLKTVGSLTIAVLVLLGYVTISKLVQSVKNRRPVLKVLSWIRWLAAWGAWIVFIPLLGATLTAIAVRIHLMVFDRRYLAVGRLRRDSVGP
jgi:predicted acylesterase/phospholipase RssA